MPTDPDAAGKAALGITGAPTQINKVAGTIKRSDLLNTLNQVIDEINVGILKRTFPIGAFYVSSSNTINPADPLNFGTWTLGQSVTTSGATVYLWTRTA